MNELDNNTVYKQFTVLVPLDAVYSAIMPRDRNSVLVWLNGMVSPYSIALSILDVRIKTGGPATTELWNCLEWLPDHSERTITYNYINALVDALALFVSPILQQEGLNLNNTSIATTQETVIDEWSCGYVTLTFNIHRQGETRRLIGTPYFVQPNPIQQPVFNAGPAQVSGNHFHNGY